MVAAGKLTCSFSRFLARICHSTAGPLLPSGGAKLAFKHLGPTLEKIEMI